MIDENYIPVQEFVFACMVSNLTFTVVAMKEISLLSIFPWFGLINETIWQ